jgi:hypothetical protein
LNSLATASASIKVDLPEPFFPSDRDRRSEFYAKRAGQKRSVSKGKRLAFIYSANVEALEKR